MEQILREGITLSCPLAFSGGRPRAVKAAASKPPRTSEEVGTAPSVGTFEKLCKAEWDRDSAIRAEFKSFSTYLAFRQVEANNGGHHV